jgi:branched-chain amino acid transport system substrate-binding protein
MFERSVRLTSLAAVVGLASALAACGGSSSSSSTSAPAASSTAAGSSAATSASSAATSASSAATSAGSGDSLDPTGVYSKYVGGTPGKADASKSPISIGFVNDEGGIPSFPEGSVAAAAAVSYVNEFLGGIAGHPVKLVACAISGSEEAGQKCAQQFLGDSSVKVIVEDSLAVGSQTFHQTLNAKVPVIAPTPNAVASASAANTYGIGAGVFGTDPGFVTYATTYLHAKSAALIFPADDPTGQAAAKQIKTDLEKGGLTVKTAGYQSTAPDLLPVIQASGATSADVTVTLLPSPPTCIAGAKAIQQAGVTKPVLSLAQCIAEPVKKALGDYPKWTYVSISTNPAIPGDPATDAYVKAMKKYAPADANLGGFAPEAFTGVIAAVKAFNAAGGDAATAETIATGIKGWTTGSPMMPPTVKFGIVPPLPALGTVQTRLYTYLGNDSWKDAAGGKWVG